MSFSNIESALIKAFVDGNFFDAGKVAFENVTFDPPNAEPWAKLTFMPTQPSVATLGDAGQDEVLGFLQIDLNYPKDSGTQAARLKFEAIRNVLKAGAKFSYGSEVVTIRSCGCSQGRIVNNYYRVSVTVNFYSHINR
jgi:hypothetical protein